MTSCIILIHHISFWFLSPSYLLQFFWAFLVSLLCWLTDITTSAMPLYKVEFTAQNVVNFCSLLSLTLNCVYFEIIPYSFFYTFSNCSTCLTDSKSWLSDKYFITFQLILALLFTYTSRHLTQIWIKSHDPIYAIEINHMHSREKFSSFSRTHINNLHELQM